MDVHVTPEEYSELEELIASADSPVGIDAKKTHVFILHLLLKLDRRIDALEQRIAGLEG